jgi:uncharacterized membrane protein
MSPTLTNRVLFLLSLAGAGITLYLTFAHYRAWTVPCVGTSSGCEYVLNHRTAKGFGLPYLNVLPTATYGLFMYLALLGMSFARAATESPERARRISAMQLGIVSLAMLVEVYLVYLMGMTIHAWCQWCLASGGVIVAMFVTLLVERKLLQHLPEGETA